MTIPPPLAVRFTALGALLLSLLLSVLLLAAVGAPVPARAQASQADPARPGPGPGAAAPARTLRYAFRVAETTFDPARISDLYSRIVTGHIFEALYHYDHLARPSRIRPLTAAALPEVSADFTRYTIRLRPGIYFADDPAFVGQRRELTAADYVYTFKRFADPANKAQAWSDVAESAGFLGLEAVRQRALDTRTPFDYSADVPGLQALDRYTLQLTLAAPRPRLVEFLADNTLYGAVAEEVVKAYGDKVGAHPVGTGAFRVAQWRRSSLIVLERNPAYRVRVYEDEAAPAPGDAEGQALLARFKGRRLPMVDRVEVSIIEENQPRWLSFLNGQQDFIERVPDEFVALAMPGGQVAPNLARQGVQGYRTVGPEGVLTVYNMDDPVIGGYTPERIALRRALNLAVNVQREITTGRRGQAIPAQSPSVPHTTGYDPAYRSEMGQYSPTRARALLDLHGYVDRDGDGWRDQPDGRPLKLVRRTFADNAERQLDELWQKDMRAIGVQVAFEFAKWPENLKATQAGKVQVWRVGSSAAQLDGQSAYIRLFGPSTGTGNLSRFRLPAFDAVYNRMSALPNGPERDALFLQAKRLSAVYAPYKQHVHRIYTDMAQPWLQGYRRPLFGNRWWHMVDIDPARRPAD